MKRRKKTPQQIEEMKQKKEWRRWALLRANNKCEWCPETKRLNVHHIINRRYKPLRWNKLNSMVLCPKHHKFDTLNAAHSNPIRVVDWLQEQRPTALQILRDYMKGNHVAIQEEKKC